MLELAAATQCRDYKHSGHVMDELCALWHKTYCCQRVIKKIIKLSDSNHAQNGYSSSCNSNNNNNNNNNATLGSAFDVFRYE